MRRNKLLIRLLILVILAFVGFNIYRDADIQSDRDAAALLVAEYEQTVENRDDELRLLEAETVPLGDLEEISDLQEQIGKTASLLIDLYPVNLYSGYEVDTYNREIGVYQEQMSDLNGIIRRANEQYEMSYITAATLDRTLLSTDRKFWEIVGLAQAPDIGPSSQIEEINRGITARYEEQKAIRDQWNSQAKAINETQRNDINSQLDEVYRLYGTTAGGISIPDGDYLETDE